MSDPMSRLAQAVSTGRVVVISGAGLSAMSGLPTFRGSEGYWTVGSKEYHPEELARLSSFICMPREIWRWYLYRWGCCRAAAPNPAHHALVSLEKNLGDNFTLLTQNVDGLHLQAGNSRQRTYEVHGNIDYMRCALHDDARLYPLPFADPARFAKERSAPLSDADFAALVGPDSHPARPHVLWFDECYSEHLYRYESALRAAESCTVMITVGCSGSASLPMTAVMMAKDAGALLCDINPALNPFAGEAQSQPHGIWFQAPAGDVLPELAARINQSNV